MKTFRRSLTLFTAWHEIKRSIAGDSPFFRVFSGLSGWRKCFLDMTAFLNHPKSGSSGLSHGKEAALGPVEGSPEKTDQMCPSYCVAGNIPKDHEDPTTGQGECARELGLASSPEKECASGGDSGRKSGEGFRKSRVLPVVR